jgi:hypothetical protein
MRVKTENLQNSELKLKKSKSLTQNPKFEKTLERLDVYLALAAHTGFKKYEYALQDDFIRHYDTKIKEEYTFERKLG